MNLSPEDVRDILSLLDSLPYSELTLETGRFTLQLRRSADGGWTQETQVSPQPADPAAAPAGPASWAAPAGAQAPPGEPRSPAEAAAASGPGEPPAASGPGVGVRSIVSPLPGTFYRAPQPGAPPFAEVGGEVGPNTVVAIIETMKLMNPVYAGTSGTVTQICLDDGQFAEQGTVLMRVSPRDG